jgi:8-oxo-dGTP pyrophosphatase MutT (NUDIX family)
MPKVRRTILGGAVWELPAGGVQKNESPEDAAVRELREESGISITDMSRLVPENTIIVSPNRLPMFPLIYSVNVTKNEFDHRSMHDDEVESLDCFSVNQIRTMMSSGEIITCITLAILGRFILCQDLHPTNYSSI